jgi:hypothetical protein
MIVRINQFDPANAEPYSGWEPDEVRGPIRYEWPTDAHAFELLILENDERQQPLAMSFRQAQLRQLLPDVVAALLEPEEQIVARIDGPLSAEELLAAFSYLTEADGTGRFGIAPVQKLDPISSSVHGSVRIHFNMPRLKALCADTQLGLERGVRMRLVAMSEALVNPLLDIDHLDDERWGEILPQAGFVIGNVKTLQAIHVLTTRATPAQIRSRLTRYLAAPGGAT